MKVTHKTKEHRKIDSKRAKKILQARGNYVNIRQIDVKPKFRNIQYPNIQY